MSLDDIILGRKAQASNQGGSSQKKSQYLGNLFKKLIAGSRASNEIPEAEDFKYYKSYPTFKGQVENISERVLSLLDKLASFANPEHEAASIVTADDDGNRFNVLVENVDHVLEQCDLHLDDMLGLSITEPAKGSVTKHFNNLSNKRRSKILMKPQLKFKDKIDNSNSIWIPKIREKPNALNPLPDYDGHPPQLYRHPYFAEISQLQYLKPQVIACKEQVYQPLNEVKCHWVDTEEQLEELSKKLDQVTEFAVDLEHHNYRSYLGFTCLMQISTREEDFLIDTLKLRHHIHILNSSFTNPSIVKVLHGADMDILWLQRDFGVYIVNLFDTGQASRALGMPSHGLAHLLRHYCEVIVDKKYQLADWRVRALPTEMLLYARQDTHYLLYIYDRMRNALIEQNQVKQNPRNVVVRVIDVNSNSIEFDIPELLGRVLERSKTVSLRTYHKPVITPKSHLTLAAKMKLKYRGKMATLAALYQWRDFMARKEDESVHFVMPNRVLINICTKMPLDSRSLERVCSPLPPLVRENAVQLIELIHNSKSAADYGNQSINSAYMISKNPQPSGSPPLTPPIQASEKNQVSASPVLSTNELYQSAGWVHEDKMTNKNQSISKLSGDGSSIPLFDISGVLESYKTGSGRKNRREVLLSPCPQSMAASSLLDFSTPTIYSDDSEVSKLKKKAREIHNSFNSPQASIHLFSTPTVDAANNFSKNIKKRKSAGDDVPFSSLVSPTPPSLQAVPSPDLDKEIPRSMREIYQMSNQNRKLNKEKKKLKQNARIDPTPVFKDVTGGTGSLMDSSCPEANTIENEDSFMKNIGWIKGGMKDVYPGVESTKNKKIKSTRHQGKYQGKQQSKYQGKQNSNEAKSSGKSKFSNIKNMIKKHKKKRQSGAGGGKPKSFTPYDYTQNNPFSSTGGNTAKRIGRQGIFDPHGQMAHQNYKFQNKKW